MARRAKLDPVLRRQLATASGPVEAVVQLRGATTAGRAVAPARTGTLARATLRRVERATGLKATAVHVLRNLGTLVVRGPAELIRGFVDLDVVSAVLANRQPALAPIRPVRSRPVRRPVARRRTASGTSRRRTTR